MSEKLLGLTVEIVSAYISNNPIPASDLTNLVFDVSNAIEKLSGEKVAEPENLTPAVNPKRSVREDHITCLEDGQRFKSLKRHLMSRHGLTPDQYRSRWNLASDYPMVAPAYAVRRSELAKEAGLGQKAESKPAKRRAAVKPVARKPKGASTSEPVERRVR